jgi:hypothetical protein
MLSFFLSPWSQRLIKDHGRQIVLRTGGGWMEK